MESASPNRMLNPSNRFDLNIGWAMAHRQMVRNGDAWVGITDKPIDVAQP
jgi:Alpha/beta hydrolase domain